jgi:hypothetical protein
MLLDNHGLPVTWNDALGPAYAGGSGAAAPSYTTNFIAATGAGGADANELRLPTFTASQNDRVYFTTQIPHDIYIPPTGNVLIAPHVHWTFNAEPTTGRTVIWELNYVFAKYPARFPEAATAALAETYTTTAAAEIRLHLISSFPMISIPGADCGPSMIFVAALKLKSTSTVDAGAVGLLSFDWHYRINSVGTIFEFGNR